MTRREAELVERFGIEQLLAEKEALRPRYNIAPTQMVPVVINQDGQRVLCEFKWGLIPFWTKDIKKAKPVINARSETISEKPFFKQALAKRRCLIPADGFYEWKHLNKNKIPMFINVNDHELFAFAGLWDEWKSPDGEVLRTCTIITTQANDAMSCVHDRMPVIVRPEHEQLWLNPEVKELAQLEPVLEQLPNESISMYQVSSRVNKPAEDVPELIQPVEPVEASCTDDQKGLPIQGSLWELQK